MPAWVPFAIMAGAQVAGGVYNYSQARKIRPSKELNEQISQLSNVNYFAPMLQRVYGSGQADVNTQRALARSGQGNNLFLQQELAEANQSRAGEAVRQGMGALEGQRLGILANLIGQRESILAARRGAMAGAVSDMITGVGQTAMAFGQYQQQEKAFQLQQDQLKAMQYSPMQTQQPRVGLQSTWPSWGSSIFSGLKPNIFAPPQAPQMPDQNTISQQDLMYLGGNRGF